MAFEIFIYSSYFVISVLNAFQAAIVLRSMQYLRLTVYDKRMRKSPARASSKYPTLSSVAVSLTLSLSLTNNNLYETGYLTVR